MSDSKEQLGNITWPSITKNSDGNIFVFRWEQYPLHAFTIEQIQGYNAPEETIQGWLLSANEWNLFHHNIPEEYLPYALINEALCQNVLEEEWACKKALKEELKYIPYNILREYISWRIRFFDGMVAFYQKNPLRNYGNEMNECLIYLKSLSISEKVIDVIYNWQDWRVYRPWKRNITANGGYFIPDVTSSKILPNTPENIQVLKEYQSLIDGFLQRTKINIKRETLLREYHEFLMGMCIGNIEEKEAVKAIFINLLYTRENAHYIIQKHLEKNPQDNLILVEKK